MSMDFVAWYATRIPNTFEKALSLLAAVLAMFFIISLLVLVWVLLYYHIERHDDAEMAYYCAEAARTRAASGRRTEDGSDGSDGAAQPQACAGCGRVNTRHGTASFIGHPAVLDNVTRLIRHVCPQSRARQAGKCGLCSQEVAVDHVIRTLPCGHGFHNLCILRWLVLLRHMRCPECNCRITA